MKRKTTELEKILICNNWYLSHKTYKGKLAKRVESYVYKNDDIDGFKFELVLNPKRDAICDLKIENNFYYIGIREINYVYDTFDRVLDQINEYVERAKQYELER